jgi:hypothetical protein
MNLSITCLGCCPIVLNSERVLVATASLVFAENQVNRMQTVEGPANQGSSASTQSDQVAVATNVFAQDGVGQGQAAGTVLSKFINPFPLALVGEDLIQEGSELQELENRGNTPPPSSPPPRNLPVANDLLFNKDARFFLPVKLSDYNLGPSNNIGNPKEEQPESALPQPPRNIPVATDSLSSEDAKFFLPVRLSDDNSEPSNNIGNPKEEQPESPPPPPPPINLPVATDSLSNAPGFNHFDSTKYYTLSDERNDNINEENGSEYLGTQLPPPPPPPREQRQSSPLPAIDLNARSQGFIGFEPNGTKTGERLDTIEVINPNLTPRLNGASSQLSNNVDNKKELWV